MLIFLRQRTVQTLLCLLLYVLLAGFLPVVVHRGLYTLSLIIKDFLVWMMPLTIGCFVASTVSSFGKKAPLFILVLLLFEAVSNFCSVWYAYLFAHMASFYLPAFAAASLENTFTPLVRLPFSAPSWWSADKGAFAGLALGCLAAFQSAPLAPLSRLIAFGKRSAEWILTRVFARLVPLFILGFLAQIFQTGLLSHLLAHYSLLILWLVGILALYLVLLFAIGASANRTSLAGSIRSLLPAGAMALTSGCSLSTMPWTIAGAAKLLRQPDLAQAIIPATTNIQQIGDCITNSFLCALIYQSAYGSLPSLGVWLSFSVVFILARYATAAVLGGAVFIMIPIYEAYLDFTPPMIAMVLAFNVVLDTLVTSSNVMANGALCVIFERIWQVCARPGNRREDLALPEERGHP